MIVTGQETNNGRRFALEEAANFDIIYEEGPVLAVNKEPGLLTQAPAGIDSLELRVKDYLTRKGGKTGKCYLGVPHRLDRPASGLILFATNSRATNRLSEQFRARTVEKRYWALAEGHVPEESGVWRDYMRKIPGKAEAELVPPIHPDAREAVLRYEVKGRFPGFTWLEIELETGRTHQIRLQCASRGFPLLGDAQYGSTVPFGEQYEDERLRAIALHSRHMVFVHPTTKASIVLEAPLRAAWNLIDSPQQDQLQTF
ncbi:MAG: RNA pseudouridine synthase [Planctomycetia bacterium]|nr:RNA pseudouridine synthase [Planctomycetia bacterium]